MAEDVSVKLTLNEDATSKLKQVATASRSTATSLQNVGKAMDNAFRSTAAQNFSTTVGNALDGAISDAEALGEALNSAFTETDGLANDIGSSISDALNDATEAADDFEDAAREAGRMLSDLGDSADDLGEATQSIGDGAEGLEELSNGAEEAGNSMAEAEGKASTFADALKKLFAVVSAAAVMKGISDFAKGSIEIGSNFETAMSEVQALSGATGADLEKLTATAREYGATTVFSATESASALKYMSLAGWDATQSASALPGVLDLAASSGLSLSESSDLVTDYLSAFSMEASQATEMANLLAYAQANSNTSVAQLGEAYRNSAANLNSAGQDIYTVTSLLEGMANQGFKGSEAGTALSAMMRDITKQMSDGAIKIGNTSIAVQDAQGNFKDLTEILKDVEAATDGMGTAEKTAALSSTFTADSIKGMNLILNEGMDKISGYEEALRGSEGAASAMAHTMNDNLKGDMAAMNSAWEEMQIQVYEGMEGPLRKGVQYITSSVIPTLTDWVPKAFNTAADGISGFADFLKPLFSSIIQNPDAISGVFKAMAGGFIAMKAVGKLSGLTETLKGFDSMGGALKALSNSIFGTPWAMGAAAVTAAVIGIDLALEKYNEIQIETNLKQHFGDIELDTSQITSLAGMIIPVDFTAELHAANVAFNDAEKLVSDAESKLEEINFLTWQVQNVDASVSGVTIEDVSSAQSDFEEKLISALQKETYAAQVSVKAIMSKAGLDSTQLVADMQSWFEQDQAELTGLSDAIGNILQKALDDGALSVEASTAIDVLQQKMMQIVNSERQASNLAMQDWLTLTTSGAALNQDTWQSVVTQLDENREVQKEEEKENYMELLKYFERAYLKEHITEDEKTGILSMLSESLQNSDSDALSSEWSWLHNSIIDAYGDEIDAATQYMETNAKDSLDGISNVIENLPKGLEGQQMFADHMRDLFGDYLIPVTGLDSATQGALADRFGSMLPTVDSMREIIDNATEPIPQALMDSYYEAMQVGAASGDSNAAYALLARQIAESDGGKEGFFAQLESAGFSIDSIPKELMTELDRATKETFDSADFSTMWDSVTRSMTQDGGFDVDTFAQIMSEAGYDVSQYFAENGIEVGTGAKINVSNLDTSEIARTIEGFTAGDKVSIDGSEFLQFEVTSGDTVWQLAEQLLPEGTASEVIAEAVNRIAEASQLADPSVINPGDMLNVPMDIAVQAGEIDRTPVEEALSEEPEIPVKGVVEMEEVDSSAAVAEMQEQAQEEMSQPFDADGNVNVLLEEEDNADETYNSLAGKLKSLYSNPFGTTGQVDVTLDWHITNPTASISTSIAGGTASATIASAYPHAEGGIFDTPHYGVFAEAGPEAFIPLDGSENAKSIWKEAGERLGMLDTLSRPSLGSGTTGGGSSAASADKNINLNINGTGSIRASGANKEEVLQVLVDNVKSVLMNIIQEEIFVEGDGVYEY